MTKVYLWPDPITAGPKGTGIGRIVHAQYQYLPHFGVELVPKAEAAEVCAVHTQQGTAPRVDVLHVHGMYFDDLPHEPYGNWHGNANRLIAVASRQAVRITVPSRWVGEPFRRDMRLDPVVIGHGVEPEEWHPGNNGGYLLWNKSRNVDVCDPRPAYDLSRRGHKVLSTYAPVRDWLPNPNFEIIGHQTWEAMRQHVMNADVYLATTRETFGVGTLEAMAAGVPVLGYAWGGTLDIVRHRVEGYLAQPGDVDDLERGLDWIRANRDTISAAAMRRAEEFRWEKCMEQYARLYAEVAEFRRQEQHRVAVVIPCHNYGRYLKQNLRSVLSQTYPPDEVVVVDDGSTDNSEQVFREFAHEPHVRYIRNEKPLGVAAARNLGIASTESELIVCLDADDWLDNRYLEQCRKPFTTRRELGIVYTGLDINLESTGQVIRSGWPPPFSWETQSTSKVPPNNCVTSAAMFRRTMWERSGGYQQTYAPGEDAEFWTRGLSLGFEAVRLIDLPLFHYRVHKVSASRTKRYVAINEHHPWMLDRQFPLAAPLQSEPRRVLSYTDPLVTLILQDREAEPLGHLIEAVWDVLGQQWRSWELIVHTRRSIEPVLKMFPFIQGADSAGQAQRLVSGQLVLFHPLGEPIPPDYIVRLLREMVDRGQAYSVFREGVMKCCGGDAVANPVLQAKRLLGEMDNALLEAQSPRIHFTGADSVRMEFVGDRTGSVTYHGRNGRSYRGGNNSLNRFSNVHKDDVAILLGTGFWRLVEAPPAPPVEDKLVKAPAEVTG